MIDVIERVKRDYLKHPELLFITMWAIAHVGHFLRKGSALDPLVWMAMFSAVFLIANPWSGKRLALLAIVQLVYLFKEMPFTDNHLYIMAFINAGLLLATIRNLSVQKEYLNSIKQVFSYTSIALLLIYFSAAFAKLNSGFFNAEYSCAVSMFYDSISVFTGEKFLSTGLETLLPFFIAGVELMIPVLLLFGVTRNLGILILILFHLGISISLTATALDFTIVLFSLVIPFLSDNSKRDIITSIHSVSRYFLILTSKFKFFLPGLFFLVLLFIKAASRINLVSDNLYWFIMAPFALFLGGVIIRALSGDGVKFLVKKESPFRKLNIPQYLFLAILIINISSPYMGIKTTGTFTMYSNLQTSNSHSNHFVIKRHQSDMPMDDMIQIISSDYSGLNGYAEKKLWLTYHELKRILSKNPAASVEFKRDGRVYRYLKAKENKELVTRDFPYHWLYGHRVYNPEMAVCQW